MTAGGAVSVKAQHDVEVPAANDGDNSGSSSTSAAAASAGGSLLAAALAIVAFAAL